MSGIDPARKLAADRAFAEFSEARRTGKGMSARKVRRVWVRSWRVVAGLALAVVGLVVIQFAPDVSNTPFSQLTLGNLAQSAVCWVVGIAFIWNAFVAAFGAGPTDSEIYGEFLRQADARANMFGGDYSR